jgi:hypothetical protein
MHHLNNDGEVLFSYRSTNKTLEIIEEVGKAIQAKSSLQATYLEFLPEVPTDYFEGKLLWDKIIYVTRLSVFERLYSMLEHGSLSHLW